MLNTKTKFSNYDIYYTSDQALNEQNIRFESIKQNATDVVHGSIAAMDANRTVLTLYRGLPFDSGRAEIFNDNVYSSIRQSFETQIHTGILPALGFHQREVVDIRLARWGHPMPVPQVGFYKNEIYKELKKPIDAKIYFANQDNFALPAIEVALTESMQAASVVMANLKVLYAKS